MEFFIIVLIVAAFIFIKPVLSADSEMHQDNFNHKWRERNRDC